MASLVEVLSCVLNLVVSFLTDGSWKTAGDGIAQLYWARVQTRSYSLPSTAQTQSMCREECADCEHGKSSDHGSLLNNQGFFHVNFAG